MTLFSTGLDNCAKNEKKHLNILARYTFGIVKSNTVPSQNESIFSHPKVVLVGTIIDKEKINVGMIIFKGILLQCR